MATDYWSWTVLMRESDIPADLAPKGCDLPAGVGAAMGDESALVTKSRNDWLHGTLLDVFDKLGGPALAFLVKDPESLPHFDATAFRQFSGDIHWQEVWVVTQLAHAGLTPAIGEIDHWFASIAAEPRRFAMMADCDQAAAQRAIDESSDLRDPESTREDGDFPHYLFGFLKGLRALMQEARERGLAVVHARHVYVVRRIPGRA